MGRVKKFRNKKPLILIGCEGNSDIENAKILEKREKLNSENKYALAPHTYVYKIVEEVKIKCK